jgi:hypothetical protein
MHEATSRPAAPAAIDKLIVWYIDTNRLQPRKTTVRMLSTFSTPIRATCLWMSEGTMT